MTRACRRRRMGINVAVVPSLVTRYPRPPRDSDIDACLPDGTGPLRQVDGYRALVEQIPVVTYIQTPGVTSETIYISPQVETLTGYPPAAFIGDGANWIGVTHPDDRAALLAEVGRTDATGAPFFIEQRIV